MLYRWNCHADSAGQRYTDLTARQVKELADAGQIQPLDCIGHGILISACKLPGIFPGVTVLNVHWPGTSDSSDIYRTVDVWVNDHPIGTGNFSMGFCIPVEVNPGRNSVVVKRSGKSQKRYIVDVPDGGEYLFELTVGFWGNFQNEGSLFGYGYNNDESMIIQHWEEERLLAQCPFCGGEWAAIHVGDKVVDEQQQYKTITRLEPEFIPNPAYTLAQQFPAYYPTLPPPFTEQVVRKPVQVVVVVETIKDYFQCSQCVKKWTKKRLNEYVP